jgi:hypothetical protein
MFAVLVQVLRMGTHCLVKEFHPKFHVEVIRMRPSNCTVDQSGGILIGYFALLAA